MFEDLLPKLSPASDRADADPSANDTAAQGATTEGAATEDAAGNSTADVDQGMTPDGAPMSSGKQFGTFGGVFTPTVLTILGVIMFLREGWIIGNAGLLGGLVIITLGFGITLCTALAMSSITTNIRIGAGGAYAVIAQSLGLEVGGSVGIPRYLSQALAVTLYIFGFREGWMYLFPGHNALLVDLGTFAVLSGIAYVSADFAIRVQYLIMAVIGLALVSIATAAATGSMQYSLEEVQLWGDFVGTPEDPTHPNSFWTVFAVFFPATTGIMAGANMSGDLADPKRSIPLGTLAAVGVSFVIYVLLAVWLACSATPAEMTGNYYVMMDKAYWPSAVLAGLLGATFSSGLASMVGAARILQAMGAHQVVPGSDWLAELAPDGEPRHALLVTGVLIFGSLLMRDLNAIAPLITMFFLVTYTMICAAVLIEQSLDLVSFRPLLRVPIWVSLLGLAGSLLAMFIINPTVSFVALVVTLGVYAVLARRKLDAPFEDVRSGLFVALAEWAAQRVTELPTMQERAWKPNLLVPVEKTSDLRGSFLTLQHLTEPQGSVKIVGLSSDGTPEQLDHQLDPLTDAFRERDIFASATVIDAGGFAEGLRAGMQALRGAFFSPNVVFLRMPDSPEREADYCDIIAEADRENLGTLLYAPHPRAALGQRQTLNVWIRDRSPDWRLSMEIGNLDLALLTGYKLSQNWDAQMRLVTAVADPDQRGRAQDFLEKLIDLSRFPNTTAVVGPESFEAFVEDAPQADLNVFGLQPEPDFGTVRRLVDRTNSTCMFVRDSGQESALA